MFLATVKSAMRRHFFHWSYFVEFALKPSMIILYKHPDWISTVNDHFHWSLHPRPSAQISHRAGNWFRVPSFRWMDNAPATHLHFLQSSVLYSAYKISSPVLCTYQMQIGWLLCRAPPLDTYFSYVSLLSFHQHFELCVPTEPKCKLEEYCLIHHLSKVETSRLDWIQQFELCNFSKICHN